MNFLWRERSSRGEEKMSDPLPTKMAIFLRFGPLFWLKKIDVSKKYLDKIQWDLERQNIDFRQNIFDIFANQTTIRFARWVKCATIDCSFTTTGNCSLEGAVESTGGCHTWQDWKKNILSVHVSGFKISEPPLVVDAII